MKGEFVVGCCLLGGSGVEVSEGFVVLFCGKGVENGCMGAEIQAAKPLLAISCQWIRILDFILSSRERNSGYIHSRQLYHRFISIVKIVCTNAGKLSTELNSTDR